MLDTVSCVFLVYHVRTHQCALRNKVSDYTPQIVAILCWELQVLKIHICKSSFALMGGIQLFKRIHVLNAKAALACWEEYSC